MKKKIVLAAGVLVLASQHLYAMGSNPSRPMMGLAQLGMAVVNGLGGLFGYDTTSWWN
jgi:hypothetical protein